MGADRLTSAILAFPSGQAIWTVSTQLLLYQRMQIFGTTGRIEMEIPFNAPNDRVSRIFLDDGSELGDRSAKSEEFPICNQYTIEADAFSRSVLDDTAEPVPLEDSLANMAVIDAVYRSGKTGRWEEVQR
jgi:predicted dehydrogenase